LSEDECARADRFVFDHDSHHFIAARGWLRFTLSQCLDVAPADIRFRYRTWGKPELAGDHGLRFNLSHSGGWAALAVTRGAEVGIDIERINAGRATLEIAGRFFSAFERETLGKLPPSEQAAAFFRIWTRKEAFIKCTGEGLTFPLDAFDVSLHEPAELLAVRDVPDAGRRWSLHHLPAPAGFAAALVVEAPSAIITFPDGR
jgi:4'-phosphopantetheinyl transferase